MSAIGKIVVELASWHEVKTLTERPPAVDGLIPASRAVVRIDGQEIPGCTSYTVDLPHRGLRTITLTLSPQAGSTSDSLLGLLAQWGVKATPEPE
jgi:hypothetical protein